MGDDAILSVSTLQRTNGEDTTWMRSEHGNGLHFISSAVDFLYNNFPKKADFLYTNIPKKSHFLVFFFKKIAPQTPGLAPGGRGANLSTFANPAIPKTV